MNKTLKFEIKTGSDPVLTLLTLLTSLSFQARVLDSK